jgi:serine phosphatase RsbU (regulator of sigma subunit)
LILEFAGAKGKLNIVHNKQQTILKGENFPIGGWQIEKNRIFKQHEIELEPNSQLYIYTDGFQDQFGGAKNKRFTSKRLNSLFLTLSDLDCPAQKNELEKTFEIWKNKNSQTDDMCVMGIKL